MIPNNASAILSRVVSIYSSPMIFSMQVGQLAMETLLSLTSRRAGEWFKEELRELGGLDHIVRTIAECCRHLDTYISQWTDPLLDRLRKIDRCLRVLENVMSQNEENQNYLLRFENGLLPTTVITLYKVLSFATS